MTSASKDPGVDLRRVSQLATITDGKELALMPEQPPAGPETHHVAPTMPAEFLARGKSFELPVPYRPPEMQLRRGRLLQRDDLRSRINVPIARYAALAGKSRQQLYREISARKLLALSMRPRDTRVPDWQLVPAALALTRTVLQQATDVDLWTIYWALSSRDEGFDGKTAVAAVRPSTVKAVAKLVCGRLGVWG